MSDALDWAPDALRQQLEPLLPGLAVEVVGEAASTNSALLDRARNAVADGATATAPAYVRRSVESTAFARRGAAEPPPCLLVAERQTDGRGRAGRRWHAERGASLTFSLGLALGPAPERADLSGLSLAVGVALCEALGGGPGAGPRLGLKWPNDLWLTGASGASGAGRKLGGILIETLSLGRGRWVVIGIGLNVAPLQAAGDVDTGLADLRELDPAATAPGVLRRVALPLAEALRRFERDGFAGFVARYAACDLLAGRPVRTTGADAVEGIGRGVDADGALRVEVAGGAIRRIVGGEVGVRYADAADTAAAPPC